MDKYRITSEYGAMESVRDGVHTGIDLAMEVGTKLRSIVDGKVIQVFSGDGTIGKGVLIMGRDGKEYIYGHMDKVSVKVGDVVEWGKLLGTSGNTGNSTGPHLHFAMRENGVYIDPTSQKRALDSTIGDLTPEDLAWYDIDGRVSLALENKMDQMKDEFIQAGIEVARDIVALVVDLSFSIALIGGGILILFRVAGVTRATKYFWALQIANILIISLLGGFKR